VGVWTKLKRWWQRLTGDPTYQGPTLTENEITDKLGDTIGDTIGDAANAIVRQIVIEANNVGLDPEYQPYLFWLIASQPDHWPRMTATFRNALLLARDVMVGEGVAPAYHRAVVLPPDDQEGKVDKAVMAMATWAATAWNSEIQSAYRRALDFYEPAMQKATEGRLPPQYAGVYLSELFEAQLQRFPARWATGDYLDQWMFGVKV
jgi:hypothetical protein